MLKKKLNRVRIQNTQQHTHAQTRLSFSARFIPLSLSSPLSLRPLSFSLFSPFLDGRSTVLQCQQALADAGTLDSAFLLRLTAPQKRVTRDEQAVLRFLRATETGAGRSRRQVGALLRHARSMGGEGSLLAFTERIPKALGNR